MWLEASHCLLQTYCCSLWPNNSFLFPLTTVRSSRRSFLCPCNQQQISVELQRCHDWSKSFFLARQPLRPCSCKTHWTKNTETCLSAAYISLQTYLLVVFGFLLTILTSFLSAACDSSFCFLPDHGSDTTVPCTLYLQTVVCTVYLGACNYFEMAQSDFPDLFKSVMGSFRSMLSSLDFPIVVFVAESDGCFKQALLMWALKTSCYQSEEGILFRKN